ncbi:organomercurial lyase MerB [Streptomyces antibioticus]|uniref:Alkylmercury lyase n=1 Tax=Streptomyces sp. CHR28 TaxID=68019 RepID=Q9L7K6_9ACTN|nr:organomercurial lyase MerB [Streptomyces scabiei]AAF64140.1 MerB [Streptomyces sp. CHR28]MDX3204690.1 organomercurial lyase MerB [Streptomyces scabiei]WUC76523.1 organomercurial lyase MerB [Streptomyces longwoodensis]
MDPQIQQLATRLSDTLDSALGARSWLQQPLLQLLAEGRPVTTGGLATATGRPEDEIRQALVAMPDTEYDADGRIIGAGLTLNPTPHRYETGGHTLYTWCALDTLIFPAILGTPARVTSPCHATGEPVRLTVEPDRVTSVEPATAVVSIVAPDAPTSVRASFCNQVHFFATPDAGKDWLEEHPGAAVLPVADAHQLGRPLTEQLSAADTPTGCC